MKVVKLVAVSALMTITLVSTSACNNLITTPSHTTTPTYTAIPTTAPTTVSSLGQPVTVGNKAKWTVLEAKDKGQTLYGSESRYPSFTEDKTTTGKFIEVTFIVENLGNQPEYPSEPAIVDSQGREFSHAEDYWEYVPEDMDFLMVTLQPNMPKQAIIIYEVVQDATGFKLKVDDFSWFSPETALISLGF